jgi:glucose-6-phosphate 1-dehydrogenase
LISETTETLTLIVFGGTGDLMGRKLLPALHKLSRQNLMHPLTQILAVARSGEVNDASYRTWAGKKILASGTEERGSVQDWCEKHLFFQSIGEETAKDYTRLSTRIESLKETKNSASNRIFYLAIPPSALERTISGLGGAGLNRSDGWVRLVIEKPFGYDLDSAIALNQKLHRYFDEPQVYRIDHYLGKETVQNLLVFRFANPVFESLWNRDRVQSVDIVVAEDLGIEARAGYYDQVGALRDMVQNHLTQLLCLTAMEIPATLDADSIRDEKVKVLRSIAPLKIENAIFGQYSGYLGEPGVPDDSNTATYAAFRLNVNNWRWQGVPFLLRTGKRLSRRLTQISVRFHCPPIQLFQPYRCGTITSNRLIMTLQPQEGFDLHFEVKSPGQEIRLQTQRLNFRYADAFGDLPEAYETLLLDVMTGDQTLFVRGDEAEHSWRIYAPFLERPLEPYRYEKGSWGPDEALALVD